MGPADRGWSVVTDGTVGVVTLHANSHRLVGFLAGRVMRLCRTPSPAGPPAPRAPGPAWLRGSVWEHFGWGDSHLRPAPDPAPAPRCQTPSVQTPGPGRLGDPPAVASVSDYDGSPGPPPEPTSQGPPAPPGAEGRPEAELDMRSAAANPAREVIGQNPRALQQRRGPRDTDGDCRRGIDPLRVQEVV